MAIYAEGTTVSESKSKVEIDELLRKWKASSVAVGEDQTAAVVIFQVNTWHVRFKCPMPTDEIARAWLESKRGKYGSWRVGEKANWIEAERRRRWRALLLTIKAKLVSVENGIEKFEEAFLSHIVIAGGVTVGQKVLPELAKIYETGHPPIAGLLGSGAP